MEPTIVFTNTAMWYSLYLAELFILCLYLLLVFIPCHQLFCDGVFRQLDKSGLGRKPYSFTG